MMTPYVSLRTGSINGVDVVGLLLSELARAVGRDVRHRPRPIERDQRDQVLEPVGPHVDQRLAHAARFHLEHADRLAAPEHRVGFRVVERDLSKVDCFPAAGDEINRPLEHGQRLQA